MESAVKRFNRAIDFYEENKIDEALEIWKGISREEDAEVYAKAQLNLGVALKGLGKVNEAIKACRNVRREDDAKSYARAQRHLGIEFYTQCKITEAIEANRNVRREDDPKSYAEAQFNLGIIFMEQRQIDKAIKVYKNIRRKDDINVYVNAQLNLGFVLDKKGRIDEAIETYRNIQREDDVEVYARAQVNLGIALDKKGRIDEAIEIYRNIQREDDVVSYARAQFNLGIIFKKREQIEDAIKAYQNILREDDVEVYARAQLNLGFIFKELGFADKAITAFQNIREKDNSECFRRAQLYLKALELIKKIHSDKSISKESKDRAETIYDVCINIDNKILPLLRVKDEDEQFIAHYTRPNIAFQLLPNSNYPDGNRTESNFRLSAIKGVNDPTEGEVLYQFLDCHLKPVEHLATFISCFTFNHDSLNQFRLYGKEDNKEATGVSLVINGTTFFEQDPIKSIGMDLSSNKNIISAEDLDKKTKPDTGERFIDKLPLYRCIYIDPNNQYLTLARREEITFYMENNKFAYKSYYQEYSKKQQEIKDELENLAKDVKEILKLKTDKNLDEETKQSVDEIINEALLPLRYLVKHAAFKEEQECRMVYISSLSNDKIILDTDSGQMYVEYEGSVKDSIHKIYLSPGAEKFKDHFRLLLNDERGEKVKSSKNPFKNKE